PGLIAAGESLPVPRLDGIPFHHQSFGSDAAAARFATLLLETDIARAADWSACAGNPLHFVRRTLQRFAHNHGATAIDQAFEVSVSFSDSPLGLIEPSDQPDGSPVFLYMEAESCGFVNLGPVLPILEKAHPRLPATFVRLFFSGINRWFRTYDHRDADERLENMEGMDDPRDESDAEAMAALPSREDILPQCLTRRPLGDRALRSLLARLATPSNVARLMRAAQDLDSVSQRVDRIVIPPHIVEIFSDMNPPVPVLLAIFREGDAIEACFDEERQYMLELQPEPWPLLPFSATDASSIRTAFDCLGTALDTLAGARQVLEFVPGWKRLDTPQGVKR
ncbi:MAG: hypothetical protein ACR2NN_13915, partial [Bryobacteraceae bacterium]